MYFSKQPDGPYSVSNSAEDIVLGLVEPVSGSNGNITCDNWFSSLSLVKKLRSKNLTYVATIRQRRREIPQDLLTKKRQTTLLIYI